MLFDDLTCGMCYRLDLDLKFFTGTAFRQQIFYRNGVPDRSGLLSPLPTNHVIVRAGFTLSWAPGTLEFSQYFSAKYR